MNQVVLSPEFDSVTLILQRLMLCLMRKRKQESLLVKVGRVHSALGLLIGHLSITTKNLVILY